MSKTENPMIAAILRERAGYVQYKKKDRVAACDEELARLGYKADEKPVERSTRQSKQNTAD